MFISQDTWSGCKASVACINSNSNLNKLKVVSACQKYVFKTGTTNNSYLGVVILEFQLCKLEYCKLGFGVIPSSNFWRKWNAAWLLLSRGAAYLSSTWIIPFLTMSFRMSSATLQRKLILATCIKDLILLLMTYRLVYWVLALHNIPKQHLWYYRWSSNLSVLWV